MYRNILITTANSDYYQSLLTLINGVHSYGLDCVEKIIVYNLGLDISEISHLNKLKLVNVVDYPNDIVSKHPSFMEPKSHVYKLFCLVDGCKYGKNILWLDAGVTPINKMCSIYNFIENDDVFMVGDVHLTKTYTHSECIKIMSATENELSQPILSSGIVGFKKYGKYQNLFDESYEYSKIDGCVNGDQENHRHDQSVLSILSARYDCKKHDINTYGYWTDINRNLETAKQKNAVIFVHRRGYNNINNLIYEN